MFPAHWANSRTALMMMTIMSVRSPESQLSLIAECGHTRVTSNAENQLTIASVCAFNYFAKKHCYSLNPSDLLGKKRIRRHTITKFYKCAWVSFGFLILSFLARIVFSSQSLCQRVLVFINNLVSECEQSALGHKQFGEILQITLTQFCDDK